MEAGLRVPEVADLWEQITVRERPGWVDVVGKHGKQRRLSLNAAARYVLVAIGPERAHRPLALVRRLL